MGWTHVLRARRKRLNESQPWRLAASGAVGLPIHVPLHSNCIDPLVPSKAPAPCLTGRFCERTAEYSSQRPAYAVNRSDNIHGAEKFHKLHHSSFEPSPLCLLSHLHTLNALCPVTVALAGPDLPQSFHPTRQA